MTPEEAEKAIALAKTCRVYGPVKPRGGKWYPDPRWNRPERRRPAPTTHDDPFDYSDDDRGDAA